MSKVNEQFTEALKRLAKNLDRTKTKIQTKFNDVDETIQNHQDKILALQTKLANPPAVQVSEDDKVIKGLEKKITNLEEQIEILQRDLISIKKAHIELIKKVGRRSYEIE